MARCGGDDAASACLTAVPRRRQKLVRRRAVTVDTRDSAECGLVSQAVGIWGLGVVHGAVGPDAVACVDGLSQVTKNSWLIM